MKVSKFFSKSIVTEFIRTGDKECLCVKQTRCRTVLRPMFLIWNWGRKYKKESDTNLIERLTPSGKLIQFEKGKYILQIDIIW